MQSYVTHDPLIKTVHTVLSEAKFGPQTYANKLAWAKSNVKEYKRNLENAITNKKDADTISHWKKRLASAMKELQDLQSKKESIDEQVLDKDTSPHVPTELLSKAVKLGFRAGSIEKIYEIAYRSLDGDAALARRNVDRFLQGLAAMNLSMKQVQAIAKTGFNA